MRFKGLLGSCPPWPDADRFWCSVPSPKKWEGAERADPCRLRRGLRVLECSLHSPAAPAVQNVLCSAHRTEGTERGLAGGRAAPGLAAVSCRLLLRPVLQPVSQRRTLNTQTLSEAAGPKCFLLLTHMRRFLHHYQSVPAFPDTYQTETSVSQSNTHLSLVETHLGIFTSIKKALADRLGREELRYVIRGFSPNASEHLQPIPITNKS